VGLELEREHIDLTVDLFRIAQSAVARLHAAEVAITGRPARPRQRRRGRDKDPQTERLRRVIRDLRAQGCSHLETCKRLDARNAIGETLSPPKAWCHTKWEKAYRDQRHGPACRTLISKACRSI
jgi:hypothetical protein